MPRNWNIEDIKSRGYRTGSILRVQMHNFITFDDAEVFPGPRLNIIIGPNGTGKSSLTHAICLACTGIPSSVGRSDDLRDFIKRGKEDEGCFCEVDLLLKNDSVLTVRRTLNSETKGSKWQVNNRSATQKEVKELMTSLHIDVDNLCTFMPQDRVSAFTQMNAKKLLQSTLECIKTPDGGNLNLEQIALADRQSTARQTATTLEAKNQEVINMEQMIRGMSGEVERIRGRDRLADKVVMYDVRLAVLMLEDKANEVEQKQAAIDTANKELADAQTSLIPFEENVRRLEKALAAYSKNSKSVMEKKLKADERLEIARDRVEELDVELETAKMNVETCATLRRQQEENLRRMNENLEHLDKQYQDSLKDVPQMEEKLQKSSKDFEATAARLVDVSDRLVSLKFNLRAPQAAAQKIQSQLSELKDSRDAFCKKATPDVLRAMRWIHENKHRFRGECFGPVGAEIEVKTPEDAAMLENQVSFPKLMTFLVESTEDEKMLNIELRDRMKLKLNVTTLSNRNHSPHSYSREYLQKAKAELGFEGFLIDKFDMPDLVRVYLNTFCGLHTVLCTRGEQASQLVTLPVLHEMSTACSASCRVFAVDTDANGKVQNVTFFTARKSRFANGKNDMPSTTSVSVKPARMMGTTNHAESQQRKAQLEAELVDAQHSLHQMEDEMNQLREEKDHIQVKHDEIRNACTKLKNMLSQPEVLKRNLLREEKRRNELSNLLERDSGQERQRLVDLLRAKLTEVVEGVAEVHNRCETALEATIFKDITSRSSRGAQADLFQATEQRDEASAKLDGQRRRVAVLENERNVAKDAKAKAEKVIGDLEKELGSEEKLDEYFVRAGMEISETDYGALVAKRAQLAGQLEAIVDNPELVTQYERLCAEAETLRLEHTEMQNKLNDLESKAADRVVAFVDHVRTIVAKLNKDFKRFMEELKFDGEVTLNETGGFLDYEVVLNVNFHAEGHSSLRPLSGQSHSGGERSVSTVMYLMALQELTSAPFRVVDEINQGMDERNERLVFDRIVRSCCTRPTNPLPGVATSSSSSSSSSSSNATATPPRANGSRAVATPSSGRDGAATSKAQYFLVSPKLLPGLRAMDNDDVTALIVNNGPGVNDLWQMSDVISALQKRKHALLSASA